MSRLHRHLIITLIAVLTVGFFAPAPAAAQSGQDNVTFWDDAGLVGSPTVPQPDVGLPAQLGLVYLNPSGGRGPDDGLFLGILTAIHIIRDRDWQFAESNILSSPLGPVLFFDETCYYSWTCNTEEYDDDGFPDETVTLLQNGPITWSAVLTRVIDSDSSIIETYTYTPPSPYIQVSVEVRIDEEYDGEAQLYWTINSEVDSDDTGEGFAGVVDGNFMVAHVNDSGVFAVVEGDTPFTSYMHGEYDCVFSDATLDECGTNEAEWALADDYFGPGYGLPYPSPPRFDARSAGTDADAIDTSIGVHWDVTEQRTLTFQLLSVDRATFELMRNPPVEPEPEPELQPTPTPVCALTPDMAVTPQFIDLAPGGQATVTVTMRNLCNDRPTPATDLLFSLSDGLRVIGGSDGLTLEGQRASSRDFSLRPAETRSRQVTVEAAATLPTAPLFVVETWQGGRVNSRIDGVFLTPAPAVAAPELPAAAVEPAAAAPAPLPAVLPNTAGETAVLPVGVITLAAVILAAALLLGWRRV